MVHKRHIDDQINQLSLYMLLKIESNFIFIFIVWVFQRVLLYTYQQILFQLQNKKKELYKNSSDTDRRKENKI